MGAPFEIIATGEADHCSEAIEAAFQEAARIEGLFTIYQPEAALARFNRADKKDPTFLEREVLEVLAEAVRYAGKSGGAFDPAAGRLVDLWGFGPGGEVKRQPSKLSVARTLQSSGYTYLNIDLESGCVRSSCESLHLNLGGIAKGYAIDRAVSVLKKYSIQRGWVSCGSTLYGFGKPHWRVAIQHPRDETAEIETLNFSDYALATSGDYERCFVEQGRRYSHLIDPRTGYPVSGMASVSVIAKTAMAADALSTAAFVLGVDHGQGLLETEPGVAGFLISEDKKGALQFHRTAGWSSFSVSCAQPVLSRRRFLKTAGMIAVGLMLPGGLMRPERSEAAKIRFTTEKEALARMIPEAGHFEIESVHLNDDQLSIAQQMAGKGFRKRTYDFWVGRKGEKVAGYALKLNVVGKKQPITFLIGIAPEGTVKGVEVLIYRESKGSEVRYQRFMKQFHQKTAEDPLRLGRDIRPISGATLSSRAAAYAVRKSLGLFEVVYKGAEPS